MPPQSGLLCRYQLFRSGSYENALRNDVHEDVTFSFSAVSECDIFRQDADSIFTAPKESRGVISLR